MCTVQNSANGAANTMRDFDYEAPTTLDEAIGLLSGSPTAKPLAGGTDLIDHVRTGRLEPDLLVDIKKINELNTLEASADGLRIGAAVPCYKIYGDENIRKHYSAMTDSCSIIGGIQIQSRASIGGNLCNSGPAADSTPSMIVLGGICVIAGPNGQREIAIEDFCTAPSQNVLQPGELLVEVRFPARPANSASAYQRFIPRNEMDIAVVGVGVSIELDATKSTFVSARIGLAAVGPTPINALEAASALVGQPVTEETITKAAEVAKATATPIDDMRGTKEFRTHVTGVLVQRTIQQTLDRITA